MRRRGVTSLNARFGEGDTEGLDEGYKQKKSEIVHVKILILLCINGKFYLFIFSLD